jgi:flagellar hook-basal body complex protein FliE
MNILRPDLTHFGRMPDLPLKVTNPHHIMSEARDFLAEGSNMIETGRKIGADAVIRSGTFTEAMLGALDQVSAHQQFASNLHQASIIDPDSVNVHDITIAQAQANMSLNITRNVLNRMVQGWRELINTR